MHTVEEFSREFGDELVGLLLASFYEATRTKTTDHAANGAMMLDQMRRAKDLLQRQYRYLMADEPAKNGTALPRKGAHERVQQNGHPPTQALKPTGNNGSAGTSDGRRGDVAAS